MPGRPPLRALLALLGMATAPWAAASPPISEAAVKAAFVYNFAKFAEWPNDSAPQEPIRLCLYGSRDAFMAALADIEGKSAQNRPIRVQKVARPSEFRGCHILAVAESEAKQLPDVLRAAEELGALTVAEIEGFADAGGAIGLVVDNERVQFEINLDAARRANLKISSQLLKLARKVRR